MSREFKHLDLTLKKSGTRRRRDNEFPPVPSQVKLNKQNRVQHAQYLTSKANYQINGWQEEEVKRQINQLPDLPKDRAVLIRIPPEEVDLDFLRTTLGVEVVCEYEDGLVIVATQPDKFKECIENKIMLFGEEVKGTGNIAKIYDILAEETNEQRLGRILSEDIHVVWDTLKSNLEQEVIVETSVECLGTITVPKLKSRDSYSSDAAYEKAYKRWQAKKDKAYIEWDDLSYEREQEIEKFVLAYNGEVLDIVQGSAEETILDSLEVKIKISAKGLIDLATNYPYIFEVTFAEEFDVQNLQDELEGIVSSIDIKEPLEGSPTVCVIDSGIQEAHAYLSKAIKSSMSKVYLPGVDEVEDEVNGGGHGTRVAGAILYPEGIKHIDDKYTLPCFIANARVLNSENSIPLEVLPSKLVYKIVEDFAKKEGVKVFNHSISSTVPCRRKYMSTWATAIDVMTNKHDILFIQSAGNMLRSSDVTQRLGIQQHLEQGRNYPDYLLEDSCRIANPAQSTQALTIGSICYDRFETEDWISFGERGGISSFSRTGLGIWGGVKPEVVEYGGDWVRSKHNVNFFKLDEAVCPELIRRSPQGPAYAKDTIGTSFSAPKVVHIAAELQKQFPEKSGLLYRALIVHSARWTDWAKSLSEDKYKDVIRYMGYGLPDVGRATTNDDYRITYMTSENSEIKGREVHVYRVKVPDSIKAMNNMIRIDVTLAFSADVRRTRKNFNRYFSTWVDWESCKSTENIDRFINRVVATENEEDITNSGSAYSWTIGKRNDWGKIKGINRNKSATQKDWITIPAYELPDDFCIVVTGHKGWSTNGEHSAKYSLVIGFEAEDRDIEIYEKFRIEVENEVENEVEINSI